MLEAESQPGDVQRGDRWVACLFDHQAEFAKREYAQSQNKVYVPPEGAGLPTVKRGERKTIKPPKPAKAPVIKPRTKNTTDDQDTALKKAAKKYLSNRGR